MSDSRRPPADARIDVHQHLWPPALIEALRSRSLLRGWSLHLPGEPPYEVRAADHSVSLRTSLLDDGQLAVLSLSSPLGLEDLPLVEAQPLLDAWHQGCLSLPSGFAAWAAVSLLEPDLQGLASLLASGFVGLQVPATWLASPSSLAALAPVLEVCQSAGRPVLVHPGSVSASAYDSASDRPVWWPAVVDYVGQMQAAWWSWHSVGRSLLPSLRIGFVALAGLAPLHHERLMARGGRTGTVDRSVFVETSSYGPQAVDAVIRVLGIDPIVRGSDYPYATPSAFGFGTAADVAIDVRNPHRFLYG